MTTVSPFQIQPSHSQTLVYIAIKNAGLVLIPRDSDCVGPECDLKLALSHSDTDGLEAICCHGLRLASFLPYHFSSWNYLKYNPVSHNTIGR